MLIAGAGMAGLVCAARLRELGRDVRVLEKGTRPGGSMLLSSCVVWRHLEWDDFRAECPDGDPALQRLIWERLDDALQWLVLLGAEPVWEDTENPRTTGKRFDPRRLTALLAQDVELEAALPSDAEPPLVLACGGFGKRLAEERGLLLRANPWSDGAALAYALDRGASTTAGMEQFYGRVMPAPPARIREEDFVPLSQLYGRHAQVLTDDGVDITPPQVAWHENDLANLVGERAWYVVEETNERIEAARAAGARSSSATTDALPCTSPPRSPTRSAGSSSTRMPGSSASTASGRRAWTRAGSRRAATRADWPRRSSSASPPPMTSQRPCEPPR